ncbi:MAG: hypothetical protein WCS42_26810 [Verrucomicrobiota bacterium]
MKTKLIFAVGLILQLAFLFFVLILAPELRGGIDVGVERLKENCPAQAPTIAPTGGGVVTLKTAGDFFYMADREFQLILKATLLFISINTVFWLLMFIDSRKAQAVRT